jgi:pyruvate/2-oxoglutarate dehydrogenase complex dihydrolipoamide dehydrogenase (E3) component
MEQPEDYDLVILGGGAGAKLLAQTFAERGQRIAACGLGNSGWSVKNEERRCR